MGVFIVPQMVLAAWFEPTATPLLGTQPAFLNGSSQTQLKTGTLSLGSLSRVSKLCLNADTSLSIHDPGNATACIDSWADVGTASGPYVRRQQFVTPSNPQDVTTYGTADAGFAAVIGQAANTQYLSTVVKANSASTAPIKYAVYASDSGVDTRSAAQLSGKSVISNAGQNAELCLNGQCITRWADVINYANTAVIRLQTTTAVNPYIVPDQGQASLTGVIQIQRSLTLGRPSLGTPFALTYGDGQCTAENGETAANSPLDCN